MEESDTPEQTKPKKWIGGCLPFIVILRIPGEPPLTHEEYVAEYNKAYDEMARLDKALSKILEEKYP